MKLFADRNCQLAVSLRTVESCRKSFEMFTEPRTDNFFIIGTGYAERTKSKVHRYELNVLDHIALSSLRLFRRDYDFNDCARLLMIPFVSDIPNLPSEVLEEYRKYGLSDEEILESFSDAIDFFNSRFWCEELQGCIALDCIFH